MRTRLKGLFIGEGSSDAPLAKVVEQAFAIRGFDVDIRIFSGAELGQDGSTIEAKVVTARRLFSDFELVVVHRDCDNETPEKRIEEIAQAVSNVLGHDFPVVHLVPRTMTEAWLLLNEEEIRQIAGKPSGRHPLSLPKKRNVESIRDPKKLLSELIVKASEETGRRKVKRSLRFNADRRYLMESLRVAELEGVPSWAYTINSIERAIEEFGGTKV